MAYSSFNTFSQRPDRGSDGSDVGIDIILIWMQCLAQRERAFEAHGFTTALC